MWAIFAPFEICTGGGGGSGAGGGEAGGRRHGARRRAWRGLLAGDTPPLDSEGRDDMSVWLAEIFF